MSIVLVLPLLLPVAAWSGWYAATKKSLNTSKKLSNSILPTGYVKGLNYILNEQPDKAIDVFIRMLEVDEDTVETHLALAGLFRRRGEVDRAIRIHQNLIARPQLAQAQRVEALMALGKDYLCAGVYDRAERIFIEASEYGGDAKVSSLNQLLAIYLQQSAWQKALNILNQLQQVTTKQMGRQVAHCYCQLFEEYIKVKQFKMANSCLKHAYAADKTLVRVSLLQGQLDFELENYRQAIRAYKKVVEQDPAFISEIVTPVFKCYEKLGLLNQFYQYMGELLVEHPRTSIIFSIAQNIKLQRGEEAAIDFVTELLSKHPSLKGLQYLIEWHLELAYGKVKTKLSMLYEITNKLQENKPAYRCGTCGFAGKILHWHCPSCKNWSTTKPVCGIEGD